MYSPSKIISKILHLTNLRARKISFFCNYDFGPYLEKILKCKKTQIEIIELFFFQPAPGDTGKPCGIDYEMKVRLR